MEISFFEPSTLSLKSRYEADKFLFETQHRLPHIRWQETKKKSKSFFKYRQSSL